MSKIATLAALVALVKPAFVANIDTANEEIVRVTEAYNGVVERTNKAEADLKAANDLLASAIKPEDLQAAKDAQKKAEDDLTKVKADLEAANKKVDQANASTLQAAAAAGVTAPVATGTTTTVDDSKVNANTEGKTGLARAIAANTKAKS